MKKAIMKSVSGGSAPAKKTASAKPKIEKQCNGLKKLFVKSNTICKVTFRLPKDAAPDAETVTIVGDFNNWDLTENKMKKLKNGDFTLTLDLPCNREYRFRYLVDTNTWENDWFADKYVPNDFGAEDSVVIV